MGNNKLFPIIHLNYGNTGKGIYCRIRHRIVDSLDYCHDCPLLGGSLQGAGVECFWDDVIKNTSSMTISNPQREMARVSELIESGAMDRIPVRDGILRDADIHGVVYGIEAGHTRYELVAAIEQAIKMTGYGEEMVRNITLYSEDNIEITYNTGYIKSIDIEGCNGIAIMQKIMDVI